MLLKATNTQTCLAFLYFIYRDFLVVRLTLLPRERAESNLKQVKLLYDQDELYLQEEISKLTSEKGHLAEELAESKKAAQQAEQELSKWKSKADKAEKDVENAEKTLQKALQEHSATQSALIQVSRRQITTSPFRICQACLLCKYSKERYASLKALIYS